MTNSEIIRKARELENEYNFWSEHYNCWYQRGRKISRRQLKLARIARALVMMGMDSKEAEYMTTQRDVYHDYQLEEVVRKRIIITFDDLPKRKKLPPLY